MNWFDFGLCDQSGSKVTNQHHSCTRNAAQTPGQNLMTHQLNLVVVEIMSMRQLSNQMPAFGEKKHDGMLIRSEGHFGELTIPKWKQYDKWLQGCLLETIWMDGTRQMDGQMSTT